MSIKLFEHYIKTNRIALISNGIVFVVITAHTPISTLLEIGTTEQFDNQRGQSFDRYHSQYAKTCTKLCLLKEIPEIAIESKILVAIPR